MLPGIRAACLGGDSAIGEGRCDSLKRHALGSQGTNLLDDLEFDRVLGERFSIIRKVVAVGHGSDSLAVRPFAGHC